MNIVDFFDINSETHLRAYEHLCATGRWPEGFIPSDIEFGVSWQVLIASKMADEYIQIRLLAFERAKSQRNPEWGPFEDKHGTGGY